MSNEFDSDFEESKRIIKKILFFAIPLLLGMSVLSYTLGWFSDAAQVAKKEFSPQTMLRKYEYFKDASQQLIAKGGDIEIYEGKINRLCAGEMDRISRENCGLYEQELAGLKMSFNGLAAEYNSQSNKFNWESFDQTNGDVAPKTFKRR